MSPTENETYCSNVPLTINLETFGNGIKPENLRQLSYSLDGNPDVILPYTYSYLWSDELFGLNNGQHTLRVHGSTDWGHDFSSTVSFTVNATNPNNHPVLPVISILYPENQTYIAPILGSGLTLNFLVSEPFLWARYSLNNEANQTITSDTKRINFWDLQEGSNNVTVYAVNINGDVGKSDTVNFTVVFLYNGNTPSPITPVVSVTSPQSRLYTQNRISLVITIDNPIPLFEGVPTYPINPYGLRVIYPNVTWVGFSLDGQSNQTLHGNTTLTGLTNGVHNITVYAKDIYGNEGASQTMFFSTETTSADPFLIIILALAATSVVTVIVCFSVYFHRRRMRVISVWQRRVHVPSSG